MAATNVKKNSRYIKDAAFIFDAAALVWNENFPQHLTYSFLYTNCGKLVVPRELITCGESSCGQDILCSRSLETTWFAVITLRFTVTHCVVAVSGD